MPVRSSVEMDGDVHWMFSRATVERIEGWHAQRDGSLVHRLPARFAPARTAPAALLAVACVALRAPVRLAVEFFSVGSRSDCWANGRAHGHALGRRAPVTHRQPLALAWTLALVYLFIPWLGLHKPARTFSSHLTRRLLPDLLLDPGPLGGRCSECLHRGRLDQGSSCRTLTASTWNPRRKSLGLHFSVWWRCSPSWDIR